MLRTMRALFCGTFPLITLVYSTPLIPGYLTGGLSKWHVTARPPRCTLVTRVYCFVSQAPAQSSTTDYTSPAIDVPLPSSHLHHSGSLSARHASVDVRRGIVVYSTKAGCVAHSIRRATCRRKDDVWGGI
ncbi:hypothetical protein BDQ17DRAFT_905862 [Cyathus striatus]|nr:hypothetical protein BDQ17DRAFT_905862 [Cyathus striatus]